MTIMVLSWILTAIVLLFTFVVWHRKKRFGIFKRMGINGPQPAFLVGNFLDIRKHGMMKCWEMWREKYGPLYGYFEGPLPVLVTQDPEIIRQVFVKDSFQHFSGRRIFPAGRHPKHNPDIFMSEGETWKRIRSISSPFFSSGKMKQMSPLINRSVDTLLKVLEEKCEAEEPFDVAMVYQGLSLEVICACVFGIDVDAQVDVDHPVLKKAREVFVLASKQNVLQIMAFIFPELRPFWYNVGAPLKNKIFGEHPFTLLRKDVREVINMRRKEKIDRVDFIKLMLDATEQVNDGNLTMNLDDTVSAQLNVDDKATTKGTNLKKQGMNDEEIELNLMIFLLAGYETTSTALSYTSYRLALNPHVQDKLQQEIDDFYHITDQEVDYQSIQKLSYLHMVACETLRMHPVAPAIVLRRCVKPCTIKGMDIEEGMLVLADSLGLQYDAKLWGPEDPQLFVPERFLPERKAARDTVAWIPFGYGQRNCIGMRFALMEYKIALIRILKSYTIVKLHDMQIPLKLKEGATFVPKDGVRIILKRRQI